MRLTYIVLFIASLIPTFSFAQSKNNFFGDINYTSENSFGISATYNRRLAKHVGLGLGAQVIDYSDRARTAVYLDLRGYWNIKRSLIFAYGNAGIDFYKGYHTLSGQVPNNALYLGLGLGYSYQINKRNMGPYIALKWLSNSYTTKQYDPYGGEATVYNFTGWPAIALGFRI